MACYYIVISSTHLHDGQLRNIKGVFRGPIGTPGQRNTVRTLAFNSASPTWQPEVHLWDCSGILSFMPRHIDLNVIRVWKSQHQLILTALLRPERFKRGFFKKKRKKKALPREPDSFPVKWKHNGGRREIMVELQGKVFGMCSSVLWNSWLNNSRLPETVIDFLIETPSTFSTSQPIEIQYNPHCFVQFSAFKWIEEGLRSRSLFCKSLRLPWLSAP